MKLNEGYSEGTNIGMLRDASIINAQIEDTFPKLLRRNYQKFGISRVASREKVRGIWKEYTWADYYYNVKLLSLAFLHMGLKKDDKVAIIGENKPQVYWYELAAQANRATVVGIFVDCTPPEIKYFIQHSDSKFVICQDQEQVDKVLQIKDEIPSVQKVVYWEKKGMWSYDEQLLTTMDIMLEIGKNYHREHPHFFDSMIDETHGDDIALFLYTSGTSTLPKGAMVNSRSLIGIAEAQKYALSITEADESLSYLPIAWIPEQVFNLVCSLQYGFTVNFPEKQETLQENIREVGPTFLLLSPQAWEGHIKTIRVRILSAGWLNRICFNTSLKVGYIMSNAKIQGRKVALGWRVVYFFVDKIVFRPLRDRLGMSRIRVAATGGTPISPDVFYYFHSIGIQLLQMYGSSELGVVSIHSEGRIKPETCGEPLKGYEVNISEEGEILVRCPYLFQGYYKAPDKLSEVIKNGWYHTGDFGKIDNDGHLIVMDRMDHLRPIAGNKLFSPQFAEVRLRFSPYIKHAVVTNTKEIDYTVAIIIIDYDNVGQWAEDHHIPYTTYVDLSQKEETVELVRKEIQKINEYLPNYARIKRFINLHKEFDPDEAELTRTRKVRRDFLEEKYEKLIEALVSGKTHINVTVSVTYRDGRKAELERLLSVNQVEE